MQLSHYTLSGALAGLGHEARAEEQPLHLTCRPLPKACGKRFISQVTPSPLSLNKGGGRAGEDRVLKLISTVS